MTASTVRTLGNPTCESLDDPPTSITVFYDSPKAGPVEQAPVATRTDLNPGIAVPTHDHNVEDACRLTSVLVLHTA
jgi:hypothetical protein